MTNIFTSLQKIGFNPIPLKHGTKESIVNWKKYQTQKASIQECQKWDKGKYNVAIITGKISGIWVLDIDGEKGANTLKALKNQYGELPKTVSVKTGKGKHYYFRYNAELGEIHNLAGASAHGEVMTGVDVRGDGGYVVAPPSLHPNGNNYEWANSPFENDIADAPEWLLDLVVKPNKAIKNNVVVNQLPESFMNDVINKQCLILEEKKEGERNIQLNKSAFVLGQIVHYGLPEERVIASLKASALKIGLEEREINATIASGFEKGKENPRLLNDRWDNPDMSVVHRPEVILPECPHHLLGEKLELFINDASACKCAAPDYVMAALLCTAAGVIGNARQVEIWQGWPEATSLWFMLVGLPSCNKSPALDAVFPIVREFEAKYQQQYKLEMREYKLAMEQRKANKEFALVSEEPKAPIAKRLVVQDSTVEKLALILSENVRGLIGLHDELAGLLANLEKHGGDDRPFYLESFGGRSKTIDRVKYSTTIFVPSVLISIIGSIQPEKLDQLMLQQPDDGLASRFLYVYAIPRKIKEPDVTPNYELLRNIFVELEKLDVPLDEYGAPNPKILTLCTKGRSLMEEFGGRLQECEQREHGMLISHLGKLRGIAARIALVLHYLEWAQNPADEQFQIDVCHVEKAIYMVEHYFYPMGKYCLSNVSVPQDEQDALMVARWIVERKPSLINAREVLRDVIPSRNTKRRDAALIYLEEAGWIKPRETHNKSVNYDVNPRVLKV